MSNNKLTPLKAIRKKCLDCSAYQPKEIRLCPDTECSLYPYRFGKNPNRRGIGKKLASFSRNSSTQIKIPSQTEHSSSNL